jgi:hypothetical protein
MVERDVFTIMGAHASTVIQPLGQYSFRGHLDAQRLPHGFAWLSRSRSSSPRHSTKDVNAYDVDGVTLFDFGLPVSLREVYGFFKHGRLEGQVDLIWDSGDRFLGNWKDGNMDGFGVLLRGDGHMLAGDWHCGQLNGCGYERRVDGSLFWGTWQGGLRHGLGTQQQSGGARWGCWQHGVLEGPAATWFSNGDTSLEVWHAGHKNGPAVTTMHGGSKRLDIYADDTLTDSTAGVFDLLFYSMVS